MAPGSAFRHSSRMWSRACAAVLAWSVTAPAQGPAQGPASAPSRCAEAAGSRSAQVDSAAALYRQFECRFLRGDYQGCLPFLQKACKLTDSPRCAFNMGAVYHALMQCEAARSYYLRYLELEPYDVNGDAARSALEELALSCGSPPPVVVVEPEMRGGAQEPVIVPARGVETAPAMALDSAGVLDAPTARDRDGKPLARTLGWGLVGAGAASGAGALVALLHGWYAERDATARDRRNGDRGLTNDSELRAIDRSGRRSNRLGLGFGSASALLLGAGATVLLVDLGGDARVSIDAATEATLRYQHAF